MMSSPRFLSALAILLCATAQPYAQKRPDPAPIRIYVTSSGAVNGLTDPNKDNQDSATDLRKAIKLYKTLLLAESRDDARIVLIVTGRDRTLPLDCTVRTTFLYQGTEVPMSASSMPLTATKCGGGWGRSAGKVAQQVDAWVKANRDKLPPR